MAAKKKPAAKKQPVKKAQKKSSAKKPAKKTAAPKKPAAAKKTAATKKSATPKRPRVPYFFYADKRRPELLKQEDHGNVGVQIGHEWRKMGKGARAPYDKKAQEDKQRYAKQKKK